MSDLKNSTGERKGKVVYNIGIVKGIVRLAVEDVSGVAIRSRKKSPKNNDGIKVDFSNGQINVSVPSTCTTVTAYPTSLTIFSGI